MKFFSDKKYSVAEIAMFFKTGSLDTSRPFTSLSHFLHGFGLNAQKESTIPFQYFNYWVKVKLNRFGATAHWTVAILEKCQNDESKALNYFFELLDEFLSLTMKRTFIAHLNRENFAFYYSNNITYETGRNISMHVVHDPAPYTIKVFEFDYCVHAYHFDYWFEIEERQESFYSGHHENMDKCLDRYNEKFGAIDWLEIEKPNCQIEFQETIVNCKNRNNHNFI